MISKLAPAITALSKILDNIFALTSNYQIIQYLLSIITALASNYQPTIMKRWADD